MAVGGAYILQMYDSAMTMLDIMIISIYDAIER